MIVNPTHVVVPYAEFLERRERRCRVASEFRRQDAQGTIDAEAVAVAVARPPSSERNSQHEGPGRAENAEPAT